MTQPNCFALLTGSGRGAVGVIWIWGEQSGALLLRHFRPAGNPPLAARPIGAVVYGEWLHAGTAESGTEDVVVLRLGAEEFEVHIHGGRQSRESLRQTLLEAGFVEQSAPNWLRSRCASGLAAVVQEQLLKCETERAARWLLNQELAWREWIEAVEPKLVAEDFSEVGVACAAVLHREKLAMHLTEPWKVVLGGEPNVGKSSLINALAGFSRAIVHDSPGTTRDVVTQRLVMDGWLVELADTAGQRVASSAIEASGIMRAREIWRTADCRVAVTDATRPLEASQIDWQPPPHVLVANKADLPEARWGGHFLAVSALSQTGLEQLQAAILKVLVPEVTAAPQPLPLGEELPRLVEHLSRAAAARDAARLADGLRRIREYCGLSPCPNG